MSGIQLTDKEAHKRAVKALQQVKNARSGKKFAKVQIDSKTWVEREIK